MADNNDSFDEFLNRAEEDYDAGDIEAAEAGCTVLVVEKAGVCGGDSYMCGGAIQAAGHPLQEKFSGISGDTGEKFAEDIIRWGQGLVDEDMVRDVCVNSAD